MRTGFAAFSAVSLSVIVAVLVWGGELQPFHWANHDAANSLYVAQRMTEGDVLYVDWYYFVTPPVAVVSLGACIAASISGLAPPTVLHLGVVATALLGLYVLRKSLMGAPGRFVPSGLAYLGILAHPGYQVSDFAQREHFFALVFVPYFSWRFASERSGLAARVLVLGVGFWMVNKPHFLAAVLLTEAFCSSDARDRRTVWGLLTAGALLPFALLAASSLESFEAFFEKVVPYHLGGSYEAFSHSIGRYLVSTPNLAFAALLAVLLASGCYSLRRGALTARTFWASAVVGLALYLSILHQGKFYAYHSIPFVAFAFVVGVQFVCRALETISSVRLQRLCAAVILVPGVSAVVLGTFELYGLHRRGPPASFRELEPLLREEKLVMLISPSVSYDFFNYTFGHELDLVGPWTSHFTFGALLAIGDPVRREAAVREHFAPLVARLHTERPGLVLFSPSLQSMPGVTMHDVIVDEYGLFPTPEYTLRKRFPSGWIAYGPKGLGK